MNRLLFLITCVLFAGLDRLCGRGLAVNSEAAPPAVSVGLPSGLDPEKVRARKAALIAAGTDPLLAEKLAIDAELEQSARDAKDKPATVPLGFMTVAQLTELAAKRGVDLAGATKESDILAALAANAETQEAH